MIPEPEVNTALFNFLQILIFQNFSSENYCTVLYQDPPERFLTAGNTALTESDDGCNHFCEIRAALEQVFIADQLPVLWITTGSDDEDKLLAQAIEIGCQSYITLVGDVERFLERKLAVKEHVTQRGRDQNFLVVAENATFTRSSEVYREALNFYPNFWAMVPSESGFDFYTQNFTTSNTTDLYLANSFDLENGTFSNPEVPLFHDKIFNLGGRAVPMGVVDYVPYCVTRYVETNRGNADAHNSTLHGEVQIEGLEGDLIAEFCRMRKCSLKVWPFGFENWGYINEDGTGDGLLYSAYSKRTEAVICCIYYTWRRETFDGSKSVAKSSVVVLVPRPKLLPFYLTPIYPFSPQLWMVVFTMMMIMTVVHHGITTLNLIVNNSPMPPIEKSVFDMMSIYLDQGIFPNTSTSSYRTLISFILLSGVVLSNSYAGGLASSLTIPKYDKAIESTHDLAQSPYRWGSPSIAWIYSILTAEQPDMRAVVSKFDEIPDPEVMYQRSLKGDFGLGIELLNSQRFVAGPFIREDNLHLFASMKEILYFDYSGAFAQKGWPLMAYFDQFIMEAVQHGFVIHWERRLLRKHQTNRFAVALEEVTSGGSPEPAVQKLVVEHILGAMFILWGGSVLGGMVLALELAWNAASKWNRRRLQRRAEISGHAD